jgi:hypothetical protein
VKWVAAYLNTIKGNDGYAKPWMQAV